MTLEQIKNLEHNAKTIIYGAKLSNFSVLSEYRPFYARYKQRDPDPGICRVKMINWEHKQLTMSNGCCCYFPSFDEVKIENDIITLLCKHLYGLLDMLGECDHIDHNGNCQSHFVESPCRVGEARKFLKSLLNNNFDGNDDET